MRCRHCRELIYIPNDGKKVWIHANGKTECKDRETKAEPAEL